jgi:hypothetical protein
MKEKDLPNQHPAGGVQSVTKSRSQSTPVARAQHYRSRLIDAATHAPKRRRPNALKHGVFSVCPTIPGEDPRQFQELHAELIEEWKPSGPTEEDRVFGITDAMWRKRRSQNFVREMAIANGHNPEHPAFNERRGLACFICFMDTEPETAFDKHARYVLRADKIRYLKQKFPRQNYNSTPDWSRAVIEEIKSVLLPNMPRFGSVELEEMLRTEIDETWAAISTFHVREFHDHNLNLLERLDARIARLTKELIEMKAVKQMLRRTSEG